MSTVPTYPNTIEPSPDPILEAAKRKFPPSAEELAAEKVMREAEAAYQDFQRRVGKHLVDIGEREGSQFGFALQPSLFDAESEELNQDLSRALVKFNALRAARHRRIRATVEAEERKAAEAWQREFQRRRGM